MGGKVYISTEGSQRSHDVPLIYDPDENQWFLLPKLPYVQFSLVSVADKGQLLAIGGSSVGRGVLVPKMSNTVFLWDEVNKKWLTPYPNIPTARSCSSSISHKSMVIVAGGITNIFTRSTTRAVEVLHINDSHLPDSQWSIVKHLPYNVQNSVPLIVGDELYIANGFCSNWFRDDDSTHRIVSVSIPELLQSKDKDTSSSLVWNKLTDMPYSSWSINHYQGSLIIFTGDHKVKQPGQTKSTWELISQIHLYNPDTKSWDLVGDVPYNFLMSKSVHISENELLFIGGMTGTHRIDKSDDMLTTCLTLQLVPK